jgi:hypothetical protein
MIKQIINIRKNLKKRFPDLQAKNQLDEVLDKTGKIINIELLTIINKDQEEQTSSLS